MSIITLTDRISVSVRAKNNTEKSAQNKATGANIQKALGGSGLNDTDLEGIGNVNSITDENGNEWIKMEDIIAAGRKMKEKGAFDKKSYKFGDIKAINIADFPVIYHTTKNVDGESVLLDYIGYGPVRGYESEGYVLGRVSGGSTPNDYYLGIIHNNDTYTVASYGNSNYIGLIVYRDTFINYGGGGMIGGGSSLTKEEASASVIPITDHPYGGPGLSDYGNMVEINTPSSLIDWDAPNAEVERQIKNLHETWDVTDHPGAVTGNGTYILAGPIEFNDGD